MFLELGFSFIFMDSGTVNTPAGRPSRPFEHRSYSSRLPVHVLFIHLCFSNLLRFTCLFCASPKYCFLFTKSFKVSGLWHHPSFPKHWLFWAQYCVHSAESLLTAPWWKHYRVMCRDPKSKSGPEVAGDYSWGEFSISLFVPAQSHWMALKSLTENLGQHIA